MSWSHPADRASNLSVHADVGVGREASRSTLLRAGRAGSIIAILDDDDYSSPCPTNWNVA